MEPIFSTNFSLISGVPEWCKGYNFIVRADLYEDRVVFVQKFSKPEKTVTLYNFQITDASFYTEEEIIEKSRSVIGRSVAGAALFGPLGSIIGGMSGISSKKTTYIRIFYTISYMSLSDEEGMLTFGTDIAFCDKRAFDSELKKYIKPSFEPTVTANDLFL